MTPNMLCGFSSSVWRRPPRFHSPQCNLWFVSLRLSVAAIKIVEARWKKGSPCVLFLVCLKSFVFIRLVDRKC